LQHYFTAINNRDYDAWMEAVAAAQSAPQTSQQWSRDYATTVDSNLAVMTIADAPLRARMMFTSEQSVELAPPSLPVSCINWDVTYLLSDEDGDLVLSGIDPSAQSMTACG
jgi:broad specificity polyphosphatase/5'/3'-nucleotidase SurE